MEVLHFQEASVWPLSVSRDSNESKMSHTHLIQPAKKRRIEAWLAEVEDGVELEEDSSSSSSSSGSSTVSIQFGINAENCPFHEGHGGEHLALRPFHVRSALTIQSA